MPATFFGTARGRERAGARWLSRCVLPPWPFVACCASPNNAIGAPPCNVRAILLTPGGPAAQSARGRRYLPCQGLRLATLPLLQAREAVPTGEAGDSNPRPYGARCPKARPAEGTRRGNCSSSPTQQ